MTAIAYPLVNGVRHSFVSIILKVNGLEIKGFKAIDYSRTRERGMVYGNSPDPIGKTKGKNAYKASAEILLAEFNLLQSQLGAGYGDVFFDISVAYAENGLDIITDQILGCTLDSSDASYSEGVDGLARKIEFTPIKILFNGLDDMAVPLTAPQT